MKKTFGTQKTSLNKQANQQLNDAQDDYFLSAIKKKGFCHVSIETIC